MNQICLVIVFFAFVATQNIPTIELDALNELYDFTLGDNWNWDGLDGRWDFSSSDPEPCDPTDPWQGITCTTVNNQYRVDTLSLSGYNLVGILPDSIGDFTFMTLLDLSDNKLISSIPLAITNLNLLVDLKLSSNELTGPIPDTISNFSVINFMYLDSNQLTNSIPSTIGSLIRLEVLNLSSNSLTGPIPDALGDCTGLGDLRAYSNQLSSTIPESIGSLTFLANLELQDNHLTGDVPESFGNLKFVNYLLLYNNRLDGTIPDTIGDMAELEILFLYSNYLRGTIPSSIERLSYLVDLGLYTNSLEGNIPSGLGSNMQYLSVVDLMNNKLTGPIPSNITGCPILTAFWVGYNNLTGTLPADIGSMQQLVSLILSDNPLEGTLPASMTSLTLLEDLYISDCKMSGTVPEIDMTNMGAFYLDDCYFNGTLPSTFAFTPALQFLTLSHNNFTGSLPELSHAPLLESMFLDHNEFSGPIPASYSSNLKQVTTFSLSNNLLTGPIDVFCNKTLLQNLYLSYNLLNGTIPDCLEHNSAIENLYLYNNFYSGPLPASVFSLPLLENLDVQYNELTGSLPAVPDHSKMTTLSINNNGFTGRLPDTIGNLKFLTDLYAGYNYLSGPIPDTIGQLRVVSYLEMYNNNFDGTIPATLCNNSLTSYIVLSNNALTGSLTCDLSTLLDLNLLYLQHNDLYGTLPDFSGLLDFSYLSVDYNNFEGQILNTLSRVKNLWDVSLSNNLFSGTIPNFWGYSVNTLRDLTIAYNSFTGTLPTVISTWKAMGSFLAYDNQLTGTLDGVFNASNQFELSQIDVSSNELTGTLPGDIFDSPVLTVFAAMDNCIHGTLPENICRSKVLGVLILDGMMSGNNCQKRFFKSLNTYALSQNIKATVPACLFTIPALHTLHLSGNGFTGTLPSDLSIGAYVNDLSLSHNALSGPIPLSLQTRAWSTLDLSYNRFSGELSSVFYPPYNSSVSLEVNRLSSDVPSSLYSASNLNVLDGNLFACNMQRTNLPDQDPNYSTYQCGSNSLNYSLYLFIALLMSGLCVLALGAWAVKKYSTNEDLISLQLTVESWWAIYLRKESKLTAANNVGFQVLHYHLSVIRKTGVFVMASILMFLLPMYVPISVYYSMYSESYAWEVSAIYLSGVGASVTLLCFWTIWAAAVAFLLYCLLPAAGNISTEQARATQGIKWWAPLKTAKFYKGLLLSSSLLLVNAAAVTAVNVGYVYVNHTASSGVIFVVQIAVVFFKLAWNGTAVKRLVRIIVSSKDDVDSEVVFRSRVRLLSIITLFNNLVPPFVATAFISSDCFNNIFVPAATITSTYVDRSCQFGSGLATLIDPIYQCDLEDVLYNTSSFVPPFMYSYQCASTFVSTYASVFVYMFIVIGFVRPASQVVLKVLLKRYGTDRQSYLLDLLDFQLPNLLRKKYEPESSSPSSDTTKLHHKKVSTPFQVDSFTAELINFFGILFSFGVVFPPLGVVIVAALVVFTRYTQLLIGRYVALQREHKPQGYEERVSMIQKDATHVGSLVRANMWVTVLFATLLFAYLLFDTLGDKVGLEAAIWIPILTCVLPLLAWLVFRLNVRYRCIGERVVQSVRSFSTGDVPMTSLASLQKEAAGNVDNGADVA